MNTLQLVQKLTQSLDRSRVSLTELQAVMEANRVAWIAVKPETLDESVQRMTSAAEAVQREEAVRAAIVEELGATLGLTGAITVTRLIRALPAQLGESLRSATRRLDGVTRSLGGEARFGERLLNASRRMHDGLLHQAAAQQDGSSTRAYTRGAQQSAGGPRPGSLVNGIV